jgi:dihydroorotate dehydrogenase
LGGVERGVGSGAGDGQLYWCKGSVSEHLDIFEGNSRGIAGTAISEAVRQQVATFQSLIREHRSRVKTIAVGGISNSKDVSDYLKMGVEAVQVATAAMLDPFWAVGVKSELHKTECLQQIECLRTDCHKGWILFRD